MLTNKEIEEKIAQYKNLENRIELETKKLERARMAGGPKELSSIDPTGVHGGPGQKTAEESLLEVQRILVKIAELKKQKAIMDDIISEIKQENPEGYKFFDAYYMKNKDMEDTAKILGYSPNSRNTIYKIKNNLLANFREFM